VRIVGGLRLTGQTEGYDVAAYHVHTGAHEDGPGQDFSAVRVVRRVLTESSLGVLRTRRAAGAFPGGGGQQTAGSDLTFQTSRFLFGSGARVREIMIQARFEHIEELETDASSWERGLVPLFVRLPAGDQGGVQIALARERLVDGFVLQTPSGPVAILPGLYSTRTVLAVVETAAQRPAALELQALFGGFWSGTRAKWTAFVRLRPMAGLSVAAGAERNVIRVQDVDFATIRTLTDVAWHATARVALRSALQYDNVTRERGAYARLHWIIRPGSEVYLVHRHDWKEGEGSLVTLDRSATVKVVYTHRW
jgi:hypothetical protein